MTKALTTLAVLNTAGLLYLIAVPHLGQADTTRTQRINDIIEANEIVRERAAAESLRRDFDAFERRIAQQAEEARVAAERERIAAELRVERANREAQEREAARAAAEAEKAERDERSRALAEELRRGMQARRLLEGDTPGGEHEVELPAGRFEIVVLSRSFGLVDATAYDGARQVAHVTQASGESSAAIRGPVKLRVKITTTKRYVVDVRPVGAPEAR